MSNLSTLLPNDEIFIAKYASNDNIDSWSASTKKGTVSGIGVEVSGLGAWAQIKGNMEFNIRNINSSKTYKKMKSSYGISGGVSSFWSWLGFGVNAQTHKEEISEMFTEISNSQEVKGHAKIKLEAGGIYPNVPVYAYGYVLVLQITDARGNTYNVASDEDSTSDTGATDNKGKKLPDKDNDSVIKL
ncbi:hypothetical protein [Serratia plymuthica]|uniref:Uncharacterized protein n=1 Tax=Serratia plymuthica S13 TaxID=1348660 RepID=S4YV45_SERPL|nr:hypothetical protein [Serratia plymuthica]AGP46733.1 hypothetical protein M621_02270 [Serratia plymuthica S13]AHY05483.1 hypothetical protein sch_02590 [Serratia plymuthica]ANJ96877.1 hypothetical protein ADP73_02570 [Serratia plymuthica]EKF66447.1 hypothetical protein B194_0475 [Serratia plymuthica A30]KYG18128.1 hypothetical protein SOD10_07860 [Serratia plymuthica]